MNKALHFVFCFLFFSSVSIAAPTQYVCTVKSELYLRDSGELSPYNKPLEITNVFVVDRITGVITGRPLTNTTARKIEIVTQGDKKRNFEVFSPSVDGLGRADTGLLVIEEWKKGKTKPFIALDGNIYSGTCE